MTALPNSTSNRSRKQSERKPNIILAFCSSEAKEQEGRLPHKIWRKVRKTVIRRDGCHCRWCSRKCDVSRIHIDHIVPLQKGGTNHISNLTVACAFCNISKSDRLWYDWRFPLGRCA